MVGARGLLACLFGLALLLRPGLSFNLLIATFGVYAVLDGAWAIASALWVSRLSFAMWPVLFEGVVSLELLAAARLPRRSAGYWLLLTGGVFSLFLALLILMLPHALEPSIARALGVYALLFGALLVAAAVSLRNALRAR
jgi:uncharacterized membrane protein HdeD (DUF308 family)